MNNLTNQQINEVIDRVFAADIKASEEHDFEISEGLNQGNVLLIEDHFSRDGAITVRTVDGAFCMNVWRMHAVEAIRRGTLFLRSTGYPNEQHEIIDRRQKGERS